MKKKHNDVTYIRDVLDAANRAVSFLGDVDEDEFIEKDSIEKYAIVRQLEVIGEASNSISSKYTSEHSEIPWKKMIDMRNRIVHEYNDVDYSIVWNTVKHDLPVLIKQLDKLSK